MWGSISVLTCELTPWNNRAEPHNRIPRIHRHEERLLEIFPFHIELYMLTNHALRTNRCTIEAEEWGDERGFCKTPRRKCRCTSTGECGGPCGRGEWKENVPLVPCSSNKCDSANRSRIA